MIHAGVLSARPAPSAGGSSYTPGAVALSSAESTFLHNDAWGGPDSAFISGYAWVRFAADPSSTFMSLFCFDPSNNFGPYLQVNTGGGTHQLSLDGVGGSLYGTYSSPLDQNWHLLCWSFGGTSTQFAVDGVVLTPMASAGSGGTIPLNGFELAIPNDPAGGPHAIDLEMSDTVFWIGSSAIDWSVAENMAAVYDAGPVDPSAAVILFGEPSLAFNGDAASWTAQAATQSFTINGTLVDAETHP